MTRNLVLETCSTLLTAHFSYVHNSEDFFFYSGTTDAVKQEPLSDEEMSPVTSVNESVDMKYEECDVPIPFPVVVIEDKACFIASNYFNLFWIG